MRARRNPVPDLVRLAAAVGLAACGGRLLADATASVEQTDGGVDAGEPVEDAAAPEPPEAEAGLPVDAGYVDASPPPEAEPPPDPWCGFDPARLGTSPGCARVAPGTCEELRAFAAGDVDACARACADAGEGVSGCAIRAEGGRPVFVCWSCNAGGRGGEHVAPREARAARSPLGAELARLASLEAASVPAFEILADELTAWGAPHALVARASSAADDERAHARSLASVAAFEGAVPAPPLLACRRVRSAEDVARENLVEGCVRETYAALVNHVQAARSPTRILRETFAVVAPDEARHAALAWDVAAFFERRLDAPASARVAAAAARALEELRAEVTAAPHDDVAVALGMPTPEERALLLDALAAAFAGEA